MIKARHHLFIYPMFQWLTRLLVWRYFNQVHIEGDFKDNGNAVLVIANHVSWWDGFWILLLNLKIIHRKFYFMMLEFQLKKHWYFRYTGGYSVKKNSKSILESLSYTTGILHNSANMVLMFPQGKIFSMYNDNVPFQKGLERIKQGISADSQILFVVNLTDYFSNIKPDLFMYIKSLSVSDLNGSSVEIAYKEFSAKVYENHKNKTS